MQGSDLGYVTIGHQRGMGQMDLAKLRIKKMQVS
jgi:hypothetical protein